MGKIIVEIQAETSVYSTHRSFDQLPIRIGRAYNNDLILDDPFISENHVIIAETELGGWTIEDLESKNGTYLKKKKKVISKCPLHSGDEFIIGKTKIRILNTAHPVTPAKILVFRSPFIKKISQPINALSITIFMLIAYILDEYMKSIKNTPAVKLIAKNLGIIVVIAIWAGLWAFVGRLIKKNAQFTAQFSLSAIFCLALIPVTQLVSLIDYTFPDPIITGLIASTLYGILFVILLTKSLAIATNISLVKRATASMLITLLIFMLGTLSYYAEKTEFNSFPRFSSTLNPPRAKLIPSKSIDKFITKSHYIFDK